MSKISEYIRNNIVAPELRTNQSAIIGTVLSYNKTANKADIKYSNDSMSGNYVVSKNVDVSLEGEGIVLPSLKSGDFVLISFISKDVPVIVKRIEEDTLNRKLRSKHSRKGGSIPYYPMGGINV